MALNHAKLHVSFRHASRLTLTRACWSRICSVLSRSSSVFAAKVPLLRYLESSWRRQSGSALCLICGVTGSLYRFQWKQTAWHDVRYCFPASVCSSVIRASSPTVHRPLTFAMSAVRLGNLSRRVKLAWTRTGTFSSPIIQPVRCVVSKRKNVMVGQAADLSLSPSLSLSVCWLNDTSNTRSHNVECAREWVYQHFALFIIPDILRTNP